MARLASLVGVSLAMMICLLALPTQATEANAAAAPAKHQLSKAQLLSKQSVKLQLAKNSKEHAAFEARIAKLEKQMLSGVERSGAERRVGKLKPEEVAPQEAGSQGALSVYEKNMTPFEKGFFASFAMIILSELGDKTFFIAAILAMRHPRLVVFSGAISALALMTVLSAGMGYAAPLLLPHQVTHYLGALLFLYFGVQLIREASGSEGGVSDELAETEEELAEGDEESGTSSDDNSKDRRNPLTALASPILIKTFTITFVAEWGDRSQIATIALAASKNVYGVTLGGVLGHAICTAIAVIGGKALSERISERTMLYLGGCVFLLFAVVDLLFVEA